MKSLMDVVTPSEVIAEKSAPIIVGVIVLVAVVLAVVLIVKLAKKKKNK